MVSLHRGRKVCSCAPMFKFSYRHPEFFPRGKYLPKITIFGDSWGRKATIVKAIEVKFGMRLRSLGSLPQTKYCKNGLRGYTAFGQIYTKNTNFGDFRAVLPHFLTDSDTIWHEGANLGRPPPSQILKKSLKGVYLFRANLYQKLPVSAILGVVSPHFKSDTGEIWPEGTDLRYPPPRLI